MSGNKGIYVLTRRKLDRAKPDMLILHPLPRVDEITVDVDDDPRAVYFQQARFGMYARMALLEHLATQPRIEDRDLPPWRSAPSPCVPTPAASPRPSTICPPWSKRSAAWTAAASATRPCGKTSPPGTEKSAVPRNSRKFALYKRGKILL